MMSQAFLLYSLYFPPTFIILFLYLTIRTIRNIGQVKIYNKIQLLNFIFTIVYFLGLICEKFNIIKIKIIYLMGSVIIHQICGFDFKVMPTCFKIYQRL